MKKLEIKCQFCGNKVKYEKNENPVMNVCEKCYDKELIQNKKTALLIQRCECLKTKKCCKCNKKKAKVIVTMHKISPAPFHALCENCYNEDFEGRTFELKEPIKTAAKK